jgi:UDP-N-acetylglucosamine 2-epimerase (non-hydrolysing)
MILYCYGTRPEYIKIKSLIEKSKDIPHKILFTSQHKDIADFKFDYKLEIKEGVNRLDAVISSILSDEIEVYFEGITYVLVQGDTATAFAVALAAFNRGIKVIHLEAGLRTYDKENPYPEESYRQFISRITDIHLCPTTQNFINLKNEKVGGEIHIVGNTVLDNLDKSNLSYENIVLITLHRRENHKDIQKWFEIIEMLSTKYPEISFILPIHPNPNVSKYKHLFKKVNVVDPLSHNEFIELLKKCKLIISDSGGIQEEASFFNKKVIVCRKVTERTESLNVHSFLCPSYLNLETMFDELINNYEVNSICPYGDGNSTGKILKILKKL